MAKITRRRTRVGVTPLIITPPSDLCRVLSCIHGTMVEFACRQGQLDAAWYKDDGAVSDFVSEQPWSGSGSGGSPPTPPAPSGSVDTSFGTNGYNLSTPGTGDSWNSIVIGPGTARSGGQIIAGGNTVIAGVGGFVLARYNANGSLDMNFGTNGFNTTNPASGSAISAIALQSNGQIIAGGLSASRFCLARYNASGALDTTFQSNGYTFATPGAGDNITCLAIQTDGKIVVGGYAKPGTQSCWAVGRYNTDGSLDTTFNTTGFNTTTPGTNDQILALALQPDGKIVVGGYTTAAGGQRTFAVGRYTSSGALDTTFNGTGYNITSPDPNHDAVRAVAILSNGQILAAGNSQAIMGGAFRFTVARYSSNGILDTYFGTNGYNIATPGTGDLLRGMGIQSNGQIIAVGNATIGGVNGFVITRYNANGSLDTSFATNGYNTTTPDQGGTLGPMAFQSANQVVAAGWAVVGGNDACAVTRYQL